MDQINFVERGSGRAILVLHGGKLDHRHMVDALEPCFTGLKGWRRVYVDLPGCGGSQGFSDVKSQDDVLDVIARFAEAKGGGEPWVIIGESRGSYIAQGMAYRDPDRVAGLGLIVPGGFPGDDAFPTPDPVPIKAAPAVIAALDPAMRARAQHLAVQSLEIIDKIAKFKTPAAALHDSALEARIQEHFLFSFHDELLATTYEKPSLIVSGRQDSIAGYLDTLGMFGCYPRATFALLDCAGHSLSWERPDLFQALVRDWFVRLEQDS